MEVTPNENRRKTFERYRALLSYDDKFIAQRLNMSERRFMTHVTGQRPITMAFLNRFYDEFMDEIVVLLKPKQYTTGELDDFHALSSRQRMDALWKTNHVLQTSINTLQADVNSLIFNVADLIERLDRYENL